MKERAELFEETVWYAWTALVCLSIQIKNYLILFNQVNYLMLFRKNPRNKKIYWYQLEGTLFERNYIIQNIQRVYSVIKVSESLWKEMQLGLKP